MSEGRSDGGEAGAEGAAAASEEDQQARAGRTGRVRLVDVAAEAGVGASIVSRVLNNDPTASIRPETRRKILEAARRLSYTPNAFARGLKLARTTTIGLVLPNLAYGVNAEIIRGAERRAAAAGYAVVVVDGDEFARAGDQFRRLLLEGRVDGLLVANVSAGDETIRDIAQRGLPFVLVNRRGGEEMLSVSLADQRGVELAVEHLVALGHVHIGHLAGPQETDTARRRLAGFRAATERFGLEVAPEDIVETKFTEAGGFAGMRELMCQPEPPTAVVCASLASAIGALAAAAADDFSVPGDVSVVAFHDAPLAEYVVPPLTTIRMPLREQSEVAVDMLIQRIEGHEPESIELNTPPRLIERASTGPAPGRDPDSSGNA